MNAVILDGDRALYKGVKSPQGVDLLAARKFGDGSISFGRETLAWIKPIRVGICGTDLAILDGTHGSTQAVILGHEVVGVVEEIGSLVGHVKVGDRVAVDPNVPCGVCAECRIGAKNRCLDLTTAGIFFDGGMAEKMVIPASQLHVIPDSMGWDVASLFEPLSCIVHGISMFPKAPRGRVAIIGAGPIGLLWALALRSYGIDEIDIAEPSAFRRDVAEAVGASYVTSDSCLMKTNSYDIVVDAAGVGKIVPELIRLARPGGQVSLFGQQKGKGLFGSFLPVDANQKELTIVGSYAAAYEHEETISVLSKDFPFMSLITHKFELKDAESAFGLMRKGECMKALILPNGEEA